MANDNNMEFRNIMAGWQNCYVSVPLMPLNSSPEKMKGNIWAKTWKFLYSDIFVKLQKKK
jgi:hypothetical protein